MDPGKRLFLTKFDLRHVFAWKQHLEILEILAQSQMGLEEDQLDPADPLAQGHMVLRQVLSLKQLDLDQGRKNQAADLLEDQLDPAEPWVHGRMDPAEDHADPAELLAQRLDPAEHQLDPAEALSHGQLDLAEHQLDSAEVLSQGQMDQAEDQLDSAEPLSHGWLDPVEDQLNLCRAVDKKEPPCCAFCIVLFYVLQPDTFFSRMHRSLSSSFLFVFLKQNRK